MIYVLMSNKKTSTHVDIFQFIEKNVVALQPTTFMTDYESAMRNAIRRVYSIGVDRIPIKGCWFHFTQAVRRRSRGIADMSAGLRDNKRANETFNKFLVLPLVPRDRILEAFKVLKEEANELAGLFTEFLEYYEQQWMIRVSISIYYKRILNNQQKRVY